MRPAPISNTKIAIKHAVEVLASFEFLIISISVVLLWLEQNRANLFGSHLQESLLRSLTLSPAMDLREQGLAVLTYPLMHLNWTHWLGSAPLWFFFGHQLREKLPARGIKKLLLLVILYGVASALIALSYSLPFAPLAQVSDRVLGLSALTLFQIGALSVLRPTFFVWIAMLAVGISTLAFAPQSALSNWGHLAGFISGLLFGALLRLRS